MGFGQARIRLLNFGAITLSGRMEFMTVRTRFAPSPTGVLHIGSVRTALFCWLYARHHNGKFVLRIEDTDRERSTQENVDAILDGITWLGLDADEGPFYQTERYDRYKEVSDELLTSGKAYYCYCSKERLDKIRKEQMAAGEKTRYDGRCRERTEFEEGVDPVVRFRNPPEPPSTAAVADVALENARASPITRVDSLPWPVRSR